MEIAITDMEDDEAKGLDSPGGDTDLTSPGNDSTESFSPRSGGGITSKSRRMLRALAAPTEKMFQRLFKKSGNGSNSPNAGSGEDSDGSVGSPRAVSARKRSFKTYHDAMTRPGTLLLALWLAHARGPAE